jgi:hypothetical protein
VWGMVLGDRSLIPEDLEEAFQRSGKTQTLSCCQFQAFTHWTIFRRGMARARMRHILRGHGAKVATNSGPRNERFTSVIPTVTIDVL